MTDLSNPGNSGLVELFEVFERDCEKLLGCANSADKYNVSEAAGVIRRLLLDESPLFHQVNQEFQLKVIFVVVVGEMWKSKFATMQVMPDGISPRNAPQGSKTLRMKLTPFLKHVALENDGTHYTVKQIVRFLANKEGSVHRAEHLDEFDEKLRLLNRTYSIVGVPLVTLTLRGIAMVVLDALEPLRARCLIKRFSKSPQMHFRDEEIRIITLAHRRAVASDDLKTSSLLRSVLDSVSLRSGDA